jgi:hypothetical protein
LRFKKPAAFTGTIAVVEQALLATIPMDVMDLVVLPIRRAVEIAPLNRNGEAA